MKPSMSLRMASDAPKFPRVQAVPDGESRASLRVQGVEKIGYEFASLGTRPYFYPLKSPCGADLTRFGHPNPVGHEHHKSVWFGHQFVAGVNFWEEPKPPIDKRIHHRRVTVYQDGDEWAGFAVEWDWESQGKVLLRQELIAVLEPASNDEYRFDLQSRFSALNQAVDLGKTNFGFLGVRVAKTMSVQFGGGVLTKDDGQVDEPNIFAKSSRWVDYSGQSAPDITEGIAYLDHPSNPNHPAHWHVRRDGWMCASLNLNSNLLIPPDHPLELRYRLYIHKGPGLKKAIDQEWNRFASTLKYVIATDRNRVPIISRGS